MKYHLQEGSFQLFPAAWQDTSMTLLRDDESGLSVVVSRGPIPEGSDAEKEFHRQWDQLRAQMGEVQQSAFTRVLVGPQQNIRAVRLKPPSYVLTPASGRSNWRCRRLINPCCLFLPSLHCVLLPNRMPNTGMPSNKV